MIIVTGGTGHYGRLVVEALLRQVPAARVGVSVRDPHKARDLTERGVRVRPGDFTDPDGLAHAFEGAEQVLIVSAGVLGEEGVRLHRQAAEAAFGAGAGRVLYTSHQAAGADSLFPPMRTHAATETALRDLGRPFVALRNGFYADSARFFLGDAFRTGVVRAPQDGPVSWTTHADLAEGAAAVLAGQLPFSGPTPPLTAAQALDLEELGALLADLTGRPGQRIVVPDDAFRAELVAQKLPQVRVDISMGFFGASRRGEFGAVDPLLSELLGRAPQAMRAVLGQQAHGS